MFHSKFLIATSVLMSALSGSASGSVHYGSAGRYAQNVYEDNLTPSEERITDTLEVSTVIAEKGFTVSRADTVSLKGCFRADEALMKVPGLLVNDTGGPGGLKTISLRGLGTAQTSIFIDGVRVGNLMSGQSDLSMLCSGNFSNVIVDYAQNSISFTTDFPLYSGVKGYTAKAAFTGGSFGTYMPSASFGYRITDKTDAGASFSAMLSDGHRPHSGIEQYCGSVDFRGRSASLSWKAKGYINATERDCPGSLAYPALSHQQDINSFLQGTMTIDTGGLYSANLSAKAAYDKMKYTDSYGESDYGQTEVQISSSHILKASKWCDVALSLSGRWNGLKSGNYSMPSAGLLNRIGITAVGSASFNLDWFKAKVSAEYTGAHDWGNGESKGRHYFSPGASLRFCVLDGLDIVAFGRRGCHIPTFNDLYYMGSGNRNLKPEETWSTDLGLEWHNDLGKGWSMSAKADGFFNWLKDKITWAPSPEDSYFWLPYNIGKVRSAGTDISVSATYKAGKWNAGGSARYSFQDARDRTPDSSTFDSPVPYIARHTAVVTGHWGCRGWLIEAVWNFKDGRRDSVGEMPSWNTLDLNISKSLSIKDFCELDIMIYARNITDCRYEISSGYPMPGWALYGGIAVRL